MAKYLEHKQKDFYMALDMAKVGLHELKTIQKISNKIPEKLEQDLQKRIQRLKLKLLKQRRVNPYRK